MTVKALMPVRTVNLVPPLAHQATDMHATDTAAIAQDRSGAIALIAARAYSTRAIAYFDYEFRLCYSGVVSKEIQDWRPVAPAAKAASTKSAAFCFAAPFMAAHSGSRKTRRFRSAGARYANLIGLPPRLASWEAVNTTAPTEAIMADIIEHPRARPERVIQTRVRGRLPKAVPTLWRARSNKRMAQYEAEQIAEKIAAYNDAIERAAHYIRECKLTILNLSTQRAKGGQT